MSILMKGEQSASKPGFFSESISDKDPEVADAINKEFDRQQYEIELIASENIVSKAVLEAAGSVLTNKYAEGYPGRRYYGGCQFVDIAEQLAIAREITDLEPDERLRVWQERTKGLSRATMYRRLGELAAQDALEFEN